MEDLRSSMDLELKSVVVPQLRLAGFKGSLPHFRRVTDGQIDLLTFQFDRNGGGFLIEISRCALVGTTTPWGKAIGPKAVTAWDMHPDRRYRLKPSEGNGVDSWFRFDSNSISVCSEQVLQSLSKAEQWWRDCDV